MSAVYYLTRSISLIAFVLFCGFFIWLFHSIETTGDPEIDAFVLAAKFLVGAGLTYGVCDEVRDWIS